MNAFVRNALAWCAPIRAGMTESAVDHIPGMQAGTTRQRIIPDIWVETPRSAVAVNQSK